jgi:eukaryotic-like serine/threonine-protein kinase
MDTPTRGSKPEVFEQLRKLHRLRPSQTTRPEFYSSRGLVSAHRISPAEVAAEFQKLINWRDTVANCPFGTLSHLWLGRACASREDIAKARAAYEQFFAMWKDAEPDIPILKQAKSEYAKLQ